ncbi:MAG TPA: hypothetical protein VGF75_04970 [Candidatus Saccharimonadales bacterium]|jgi:hypothetical protein
MSLRKVSVPPRFDVLADRVEKVYGMMQGGNGLEGFDGYVSPGLGDGLLYNHPQGILQLVIALSVAPDKRIDDALDVEPRLMSHQLVRVLRDNQVFEGFRLIDLGCGLKPGLALASKALGAEVHTVDSLPLSEQYSSLVDSHTTLDLCDPNGPDRLVEVTGGNLDFVTSNIIGVVYTDDNAGLIKPNTAQLERYGERLLRTDGHAVFECGDLLQNS